MNKQKKSVPISEKVDIVNPYAAGIDIADKVHVVSLPAYLSPERTFSFGTMTSDLKEILNLLVKYQITTVAMESTGVYWRPLFKLLVSNGIEVYLVNAQHVKNVTGRKTDETDAMWLQRLHSYGLLSSSYLPDELQERLRALSRSRRSLIEDMNRDINRIQKALELMNIKFHTIISDIVGMTGRLVIEAIIAGERNSHNFLPLIGKGIKASPETIVKSLEGSWEPEQIFVLKMNYEAYKFKRVQLSQYDLQIEKMLQCYEASLNNGEVSDKTKKGTNKKGKRIIHKDKNHPAFNVRAYLERIHKVDVLEIYGMAGNTGLQILAETGTDLEKKWKTENQFISWLNLCPNTKISGGKVLSSKIKRKKMNPASQAFRWMAVAQQSSSNSFGVYYRRKRGEKGPIHAIVATANKIARIYYKMVTQKIEFNPIRMIEDKFAFKEQKIKALERQLAKWKKMVA